MSPQGRVDALDSRARSIFVQDAAGRSQRWHCDQWRAHAHTVLQPAGEWIYALFGCFSIRWTVWLHVGADRGVMYAQMTRGRPCMSVRRDWLVWTCCRPAKPALKPSLAGAGSAAVFRRAADAKRRVSGERDLEPGPAETNTPQAVILRSREVMSLLRAVGSRHLVPNQASHAFFVGVKFRPGIF